MDQGVEENQSVEQPLMVSSSFKFCINYNYLIVLYIIMAY